MAYNRFMRDPRLRGIFQRQLQSRRQAQQHPPTTAPAPPPIGTGGFRPAPTSPVRQAPGRDLAPASAQAINAVQGSNRAPAWNRDSTWLNRFLGRGQSYQNVYRNRSNEQPSLGQPNRTPNPYGVYTKGRGV